MSSKDKKNSKDIKILELETKIQTLENNWKRSVADYQNLLKRTEQEKQDIIEFSNLILIKDLLPIIDNLKLASEHSTDVGVKMVYEQFLETLKANGVNQIPVEQKEFNPTTMEATETEGEETPKTKKVVSKVHKDGFTYKEKVIRTAQVTVLYK